MGFVPINAVFLPPPPVFRSSLPLPYVMGRAPVLLVAKLQQDSQNSIPENLRIVS